MKKLKNKDDSIEFKNITDALDQIAVDQMVSYVVRLIDKLSPSQQEEFYKKISNIKNLKK